MQWIGWPAEATNLIQADDGRALPEELRRAAWGEAALAEALLTLAHYHEEQARTEADVLERETWALTAILERSAPIWRHLPDPTLRFGPDHPDAPHLELGLFTHLATLVVPRAGEQALLAAATPRWARVYTCHTQQPAGQADALVRTYVPVSVAEAVATLGFGRILARIEVATRNVGQALLAQAQAQRERQARLRGVERMLGWEPDAMEAPLDRTTVALARLALPLLAAALWGFMVILVCLLFGIPQAMLALVLGGVGLMVQHWFGATQAPRE